MWIIWERIEGRSWGEIAPSCVMKNHVQVILQQGFARDAGSARNQPANVQGEIAVTGEEVTNDGFGSGKWAQSAAKTHPNAQLLSCVDSYLLRIVHDNLR